MTEHSTDLPHNPKDVAVVTAAIQLAHSLGMRTLAEGVETAEQMTMLRVINCDQAQGFYLGRPTPASDVPAVIARLSQGGAKTADLQERARNVVGSAK